MAQPAKHTPGPWTVKDEDTVIGPQGNIIAECCGYSVRATDKDQIRQGGREANAKFIAAAPAMYEAIKATLEHRANDFLDNNIEPYLWLKQALAQAEGK